jgi:hypothetical protein
MRRALMVLCCAAALVIAQGARADIGTVTAVPVDGDLLLAGDGTGITPQLMWYDNSMPTPPPGPGYFYFPPGAAVVPVELADDVPFGATQHVSTLVFAYGTTVLDPTMSGVIECVVNFYGALAADDGPDTTSAVLSADITGLPGSPDGSSAGWIITVDLTMVTPPADFDWTPSTSSTGISENWLSFTYMQSGTGPILATGGGSQDVFWSAKDLSSGAPGSFFYFFGGPPNPEGSFYIQLSDSN